MSLTNFVRSIGALVAIMGLAVLTGYSFHLPSVITLLPGLQGMSPITALMIVALASATLAASWNRPGAAKAISAAVFLLACAVLLSHAFADEDALSPAFASAVFGYPEDLSGHTSIATAMCAGLLAAAGVTRGRPHLSDTLSGLTFVIAGMAVIGYGYGVRDLYALPVFRTMALHTAVAMISLSVASILVHPEEGWGAIIASREAGGSATRRQLAFILLPPIAGGFLLAATDAHRIGPGAAMALLVVLMVVPLALLILRDGWILNALDRERTAQSSELERRLAAQAEALRLESRERAKVEEVMLRTQRMEAMGQLTGGIAHDFNNLLMAVAGNLQLLAKKLPADNPARRYVDNAMSAADRGAKLTSQLLAFSRTQKLHIRPVELDASLDKASQLIATALGPTIEVEFRPGVQRQWAAADPDQLELAILNLALNAKDAMPSGGRVTIESSARWLRLETETEDREYLSIRLTDNGEGMPADVVARATEPFFTTKERGRGTGLGLAQAYGFVRQCGGDLNISSEPGIGTTVELLLPRAEGRDDTLNLISTKAAQGAEVRGAGQLILVIDDDVSVREVLVDTLVAAGFEVVQASDGEEGLQRLDTVTPAAAIIDFIMPGMNGAEVARRIQRILPNLPIIFVSGYYDTVALDGVPGAVVLRKPFDVEGLGRAVSAALH